MTDLDVVGMGNALVDVISYEHDSFLDEQGLVKGSMRLVDAGEVERLYSAMGPATESSGGCAANTVTGVGSFGGRGGFIGRIGDDEWGTTFAHDVRATGLEFSGTPAPGGATGRSLIVVTPDAERTMSTFLGIAGELGEDDVDEALIARAKVTYLEGYLFDEHTARKAFERAAAAAHASGRRVALSLSDRFCVERFRAAFRGLVEDGIDILFANEEELVSLYETVDHEEALATAEKACEIVVMTRGPEGAIVSERGSRVHVAAEPVERVVDTTGAGDQFAAGFLFGIARDRDMATCGRLGAIAAAEVISHIGARPQVPLAELAERWLR